MLIGARFFGLVLGSQPSAATLPVEERVYTWKDGGPKRKGSLNQPSILRGYLSFRGGSSHFQAHEETPAENLCGKICLTWSFFKKKQVGRISFKNWMMFPFLRVFIVLDSGIVHSKMMNSRQEVVLSLHIGHGRTSSLAKQEEPVGRLVDVLYHA